MEVRPQGEDCGWLREDSLKGASAPQLARKESGEKSGPAREARDLCFMLCEERGLLPCLPTESGAPPKLPPETGTAMANSSDPRDGQEPLMLLQPPRILCTSAGQYPHTHTAPGSLAACHCQGPQIQGQLPQENTGCASGCCNVTPASAASGSLHIPNMTTVPLPPPGMSKQEPPNQLLLEPPPVWVGNRLLRVAYMQRRGQN